MDSFSFSTRGEFDSINITGNVDRIVHESRIKNGIALVFAGHATGIIAITEFEPFLLKDIKELLQKLVPSNARYNHATNGYAHLRSMLLTPSKVVPVNEGHLALGTWQSIFWIEAESRSRRRIVQVCVIGKE